MTAVSHSLTALTGSGSPPSLSLSLLPASCSSSYTWGRLAMIRKVGLENGGRRADMAGCGSIKMLADFGPNQRRGEDEGMLVTSDIH